MPNTIFISGIHGSGKTTLGTELSKKLQIPFDSASNIIRRTANQNWNNEKKVKNIDQNQNILKQGVEQLYRHYENIILDGHFTLLNEEGQIKEVGIDTFRSLGINAIIMCVANPEGILERLKHRDNRAAFTYEELSMFQKKEEYQAKNIAAQLNVPIQIYETDNNNKILDLINFINGGY
ncbi:ATP-binding protein [Amphibacillus sediminis]|uniref:ATP-binding protein n=1 Tax=Amphibacillus sediminis TaxID=360185 RepID=UPI00082E35AC|nr:ATP-binding protein [Amphibacillus sediminis]